MGRRRGFTIQLTERCNLRCTYCYVMERPSRSLVDCSNEVLDRFVDFTAEESGPEFKITFFGGEPTLRKDLIYRAVDRARAAAEARCKTARFHLVTNGTLLDEAFGDYLVDERFGLEVSIDGPAHIHDRFRPTCGGRGSFKRVRDNLLAFRDRHPENDVRLFACIHDTSALPWLREFTRQMHPATLVTNALNVPKEARARLGCSFMAEASEVITARIREHGDAFRNGDVGFEPDITKGLSFMLSDKKVTRYCEMPTNSTIVTQDGTIYPCPFFVGNEAFILGDIWRGFDEEKVKTLDCRSASNMTACNGCREKDLCGGSCAFRAFDANGTTDEPSFEFCKFTQDTNDAFRRSLRELGAEVPELLLDLIERPGGTKEVPATPGTSGRNFVVGLTSECNLACDYCYLQKALGASRFMSRETAERVIDHVLKTGGREPLVCFFGGEPLLSWRTATYIMETMNARAAARGQVLHYHLVTNGTLMTQDIAEVLRHYGVVVQLSIDGPSEWHDDHRQFRDRTGSFDRVMAARRILAEVAPSLPVDAQVVLTPGHTDQVRIAEFLRGQGFRRLTFLRQCGTRGTTAWTAAEIVQLRRDRRRFFKYFLDAAAEGHPEVDMQFAGLTAWGPAGPPAACDCGRGEVFIDAEGDIYPCPMIYSPGQLRIGSCGVCDDITLGCGTPTAGESMPYEECATCWARDRCRGGCYALAESCAVAPRALPQDVRREWCNVLREDHARAIIAHQILARDAPARLAHLKRMFQGDAT